MLAVRAGDDAFYAITGDRTSDKGDEQPCATVQHFPNPFFAAIVEFRFASVSE